MNIPLTKLQKNIMTEFYSIEPTKVVYNKQKRTNLWKLAKEHSEVLDLIEIEKICPALSHQIKKSYANLSNIQSAVFSECVYAQTIANMFGLNVFVNCYENREYIPKDINSLLASYHLFARYVYSTTDKMRMLIQAGGCDGIDSALITVIDMTIYTIEFKEPLAKTSEPDLPKYDESGILPITNEFLSKYPQFEKMLNEQKNLNFFEVIGRNIGNFSDDNVIYSVSNNYTNKLLNVICTEDKNSNLVMLPANQVQLWADVKGEIRPAGRNKYKVWTPKALNKFLTEKGAIFNGNNVSICRNQLKICVERGSNNKQSRYKINSLFFVYISDCSENDDIVTFDINSVWQLNPTIAGKVMFKNLEYNKVKKYYF